VNQLRASSMRGDKVKGKLLKEGGAPPDAPAWLDLRESPGRVISKGSPALRRWKYFNGRVAIDTVTDTLMTFLCHLTLVMASRKKISGADLLLLSGAAAWMRASFPKRTAVK
jgi:hypothetical protein